MAALLMPSSSVTGRRNEIEVVDGLTFGERPPSDFLQPTQFRIRVPPRSAASLSRSELSEQAYASCS